jgi:hypothetical protein
LKPRQSQGPDWLETQGEPPYAEPLLELQDIDDAAAMRAVADLAVSVPSLDLEHQALGLDRDDARNGPDVRPTGVAARWRIAGTC